MAQILKLVASELLMCGLKKIPLAGDAIEVVDAIRSRYERAAMSARIDDHELRLSRWEEKQRDLVAEEIRTVLANLSRVNQSANVISEEVQILRQIQCQGWNASLFEGLFLNSSFRHELRQHPEHFGRKLDDHDKVDAANGCHILIGADRTHILEVPPRALAILLAQQPNGVPSAQMRILAGLL